MTTLEVKLNLPESLAKEAQQAGLLSPEELERLVREALRAKRLQRLSDAREKLAASPLPPMTLEEIQAEIDAYRAEVRRARGACHKRGDLSVAVARHSGRAGRRGTHPGTLALQ